MELYEKILCETIAKEVIPSLQIDAAKLVEMNAIRQFKKYIRSSRMIPWTIPHVFNGSRKLSVPWRKRGSMGEEDTISDKKLPSRFVTAVNFFTASDLPRWEHIPPRPQCGSSGSGTDR